MAASFAEAFASMNFENLEEGPALTEQEIKVNQEIEFLEKWLKMAERNASAKEKFRFAQENGFVSENHINLWLAASDAASSKEEELDMSREYLSNEEINLLEKEVNSLKSDAVAIKMPSYYRLVMRRLGRKDFSPYGEDLLKTRLGSGDTWNVDIERSIKQGYTAIKS